MTFPPTPRCQSFSLLPGRWEWWVLAVILTAALAFRLPRLDSEGLWLDEITTWLDSRRPASAILQGPHPVSFLVKKWSMTILGDSNAALRLPGVVGGAGAVGVLWMTVRSIAGPGPAMVAAFFAAFSPYQIHYSRDANHYGLTLLFSAFCWFLLAGFFRKARIHSLVLFVLIAGLACQTHEFNAAMPAAAILVFLFWIYVNKHLLTGTLVQWILKGSQPVRVAALIGAALLILLGLGKAVFSFTRKIAASGAVFGKGGTEGYDISLRTWGRITADMGGAFFDYRPGALLAGLGILILALFGLYVLARRGWGCLALYSLLLFFIPHGVLALLTFDHFFNTRYLAFQSPVLFGLAGMGLWEAGSLAGRSSRLLRLLVLEGFLILWGINVLPSNVRLIVQDRQAYELGARWLADHAQTGDKVLCFPPWSETALHTLLERWKTPLPRLFVARQMGHDSFPTLYRLGYLCAMDSAPTYYYTSYRQYDKRAWPTAWHWIRQWFEPVFEQPSGYVEDYARKDYEVGVYRFRMAGRLVMPFLETRLEAVPVANASPAAWEITPLFFARGQWAVELRHGEKVLSLTDWRMEANGETVSWTDEPTSEGEPMRRLFSLTAEVPRLRFIAPPQGDNPTLAAMDTLHVVLGPVRRETLRMDGGMAVDYGPFRYVASAREQGRQLLLIGQGGWADYRVHLPDGGVRTLEIRGRAGGARQMSVALELNGQPMGTIRLSDSEISPRAIPLHLAAGEHHLRLFAGDIPLRHAHPAGFGNRGFIQLIEVSWVFPGDGRDDRLEIAPPQAPPRPLPHEAARPW